jgi:acetylornithine deacetylase/succinyl-diaminopimelate desuccinylase family protein
MNIKVKRTIDDKLLDKTVSLLKKLIAVPTVNPPGNEIKLKPIIQSVAKELGGTLEIIEGKKGRANYLIKIGSGKPSVGFFPHFDTVQTGDGWKTDPFEAVIKNGRLYGRGAIDSKGNFTSSYAAIKKFLAKNKKFKGTIILAGCADEENGSTWGMKYLLKKGLKVDYAFVPDGGFIDQLIIGEKGAVQLTVKSFGKQAHGSTPEAGINALENLIRFLHKMTELDITDIKYHAAFDGITRTINVLNGGHGHNIVPATAEAKIDIRFPYGASAKNIISRLTDHKSEIEKKFKGKIEIETQVAEPHLTDTDTPVVKAFLAASKDLGVKMRVGTMGGITDGKSLAETGIKALVHWAESEGEDTAHSANEFVTIENLRTAAALYELTLEKLLL